MPCSPRWSAETLVNTETSLWVEPDALEQDAAAGRLGDRELHLLVGQHPAGAGRAGVVAGLDQLAVDVDAVGARPADVQPVACARCARPSARWWSCRWCR